MADLLQGFVFTTAVIALSMAPIGVVGLTHLPREHARECRTTRGTGELFGLALHRVSTACKYAFFLMFGPIDKYLTVWYSLLMMKHTTCTCGAPMAKHPASGFSECGACLEALKASKVSTACEWPGCGKNVRKLNLGHNFCVAHKRLEFSAFMSMMAIEGPQALSRPLPTIAERYEFVQNGDILPASRLARVTFANTMTTCAHCGDKLVVMNDLDWSADLPNSMSCRDQVTPWGVGICRTCSLGKSVHAA